MDEATQTRIFHDWLSQHKGIFFKIVRSYAFADHDQEDLFQEITLQVWKSIPDYRGEAKASTWIYRVALFTAMTWVRREQRRPWTQDLAEVEHILTANLAARDERLEWLYDQIAQLEVIDRSICLLLLDGYSYQEMADLLGISRSNVGVKIHRIKQRLLRKSQETTHHGV